MESFLIGIMITIIVCVAFGKYAHEKSIAALEEARLKAIKLSNIDNMDGHSFEKYIAWILEKKGYSNVEVTKRSGDFGVDIVATQSDTRYAIQVKRHSSRVSRRAISDAVAGKAHYVCAKAMVVTNSYFTKQATAFAKSVGCDLIDRDILVSWIQEFCPLYNEVDLPSEIENLNKENPDIPEIINNRIKKYAKKTFPKSKSLEKSCIKSEIEAYTTIEVIKADSSERLPQKVFTFLYQNATIESRGSFSMQLHYLNEGIKWWEELHLVDAPTSVIDRLFSTVSSIEKDSNPSTFQERYNIQIESDSYLKIRAIRKKYGASNQEFQKIYAKVQRENYGSYATSLHDLENLLKHNSIL